jgi:2'-5' RNA ligase
MNGIVSLLDDKHYELVENLWAELERKFGLKGIYITPFPHFSYQVAEHYEVELLESILQRFALKSAKFKVKTTGLGIFTGAQPVLFIPVVRSPEITLFHQTLWPEIFGVGSGIVAYYSAENWIPHITLAHGDIHQDNLPDIIRFLAEREFNWEITVNNLSFIHDTGLQQELRFRFNFNDGF